MLTGRDTLRLMISAGAIALVTAAYALAQNEPFFQENYPKDFSLTNATPTPLTRSTPGDRKPAPGPVSKKDSIASEPPKPETSPTARAELASASDDKEGIKIIQIGLVSSAMNKEHLWENLQSLSDTVKRFDFLAGPIFMVGPKKAYDRLELEAAMGRYSMSLPDVRQHGPAKRDFSMSPTWILRTTKGEVILEGLPLSKYINSRGEFVE